MEVFLVGKTLRIFGILGIIIGFLIMIPLVTIPSGIAIVINGIVLYAIGRIYDDVRIIKDKLNLP
jgi:hypothetical protein